MIVQNCLNLLKDLHLIEDEIASVKRVIKERGIELDEEVLLQELIKNKLKTTK